MQKLRALKLFQSHHLGRVAILMGCRPEEIAVLETGHVDLEPTDFQPSQLRIVGGKTAAAKRMLPFAGEAGEILGRLKAAAEKAGTRNLFHAERNVKLPLSMSTIETQQAKVDAPFGLYDLRHTFATRAIRSKKVDLPQLAAILGHDGIRSVMKYSTSIKMT